MAYVNWVVYTESNRYHYADAGDDIYSYVPKVQKADDFNQCHSNYGHNHKANSEVSQEDDSDKKNT